MPILYDEFSYKEGFRYEKLKRQAALNKISLELKH